MSQVVSIDCFKKGIDSSRLEWTGADFLKIYVYWATKWNMKETGEINNRHKSQSTEEINFYRQEEKKKGKKSPNHHC